MSYCYVFFLSLFFCFLCIFINYLLGVSCFDKQILRQQEVTGDSVMLKKRALNDRLMLAERGFLDAEGLQGRQWFKHLVSAFLLLDTFELIVTDNK